MDLLRQRTLLQAEAVARKMRFGEFSRPLSLAVGDNSLYQPKTHLKDQRGRPRKGPHNINVSQKVSNQLFSYVPSTLQSGDEYIDPTRANKILSQKSKPKTRAYNHQTSFKPSAGPRSLMHSAYEYIPQKQPQLNPRRFRDADGNVKKPPKNITTNPHIRVQTQMSKPAEHMPDPYERTEQMDRAYNQREKSRILAQPFRIKTSPMEGFDTIEKVYKDINIRHQKKPPSKYPTVKHDSTFRVGKGHGIGKPYQHLPEEEFGKQKRIKSETSREKFKGAGGSISGPTPSVNLNKKNLLFNRIQVS